jgi:hypothetical protein
MVDQPLLSLQRREEEIIAVISDAESELNWIELDWIELDWTGLNWAGLNWIGLKYGTLVNLTQGRQSHVEWYRG